MTSCCPPRPRRWNVVTGAIARGKSTSTGYARKRQSGRAWRWTCGVKPTPKAGHKPWQHCIVHGLDKPGVFTTDSSLILLYFCPVELVAYLSGPSNKFLDISTVEFCFQ